jgi:hypothetical protein
MTGPGLRKFLLAVQGEQHARHADRAAVVTTAILQIIHSAWLDRDGAASIRGAIETMLREEFADIQRQSIHEIRREDE